MKASNEGAELIDLLRQFTSTKPTKGELPWFFGCEYKCALCFEEKIFYTTNAIKKHIMKYHVDPWEYLLQSGFLEKKVEYFHCNICNCKTVKKNFNDIRNHLHKDHDGSISMKEYGKAYGSKKHDQKRREKTGADENGNVNKKELTEGSQQLITPGDEIGTKIQEEEKETKFQEDTTETSLLKDDNDINCQENIKDIKLPKNHKVKQSSNRKFVCPICNEVFPKLFEKKAHVKSEHSGISAFKCDVCSKEFIYESSKINHMKIIHNGMKKFSCEKCGKQYSWSRSFKIHMITHEEKTFICDHCGKAYGAQFDLDRHSVIHTGERPYKCELCVKDYVSESDYYKHKKEAHSKTELYSCQFCHKKYRFNSNMLYHKKKCKNPPPSSSTIS